MGVDGPRKAAGRPQNTPRACLPLIAAGSQSAPVCTATLAQRGVMWLSKSGAGNGPWHVPPPSAASRAWAPVDVPGPGLLRECASSGGCALRARACCVPLWPDWRGAMGLAQLGAGKWAVAGAAPISRERGLTFRRSYPCGQVPVYPINCALIHLPTSTYLPSINHTKRHIQTTRPPINDATPHTITPDPLRPCPLR